MPTDIRDSKKIEETCTQVRRAIQQYAVDGVGDAKALLRHSFCENSNQSHWYIGLPLTVYFVISILESPNEREILEKIKYNTKLSREMDGSSGESSEEVWDPVKKRFGEFVENKGDNHVAEEMSDGETKSVEGAVNSFMSETWHGNASGGGGGDTVVKRTLKIISHLIT